MALPPDPVEIVVEAPPAHDWRHDPLDPYAPDYNEHADAVDRRLLASRYRKSRWNGVVAWLKRLATRLRR